MARQHTDKEYEGELKTLREHVLLMGAKVEDMIASSVRALVERDSDLARRMIDYDHQINRLEVETDELCLRILARRQPVASDLRFITIALKLVTDLERIGDLGVNICERVLELNQEPPLKPNTSLQNMAEAAQGMVREALDAFVAGYAERAQQVIARGMVLGSSIMKVSSSRKICSLSASTSPSEAQTCRASAVSRATKASRLPFTMSWARSAMRGRSI